MILLWLILVPLVGGTLAWMAGRQSNSLPRWISLGAMILELVLAVQLWLKFGGNMNITGQGEWLVELHWPWVPQFGSSFYLALDGLSLLLIALTAFLGVASVLTSWTEIQERVGFFHFNLLWILAGIVGVFLALDLFLFFFFWEMMLIPMYFLIGIWGHGNRIYAAIKFFIFTQASGLLMLLAILGLYFIHGKTTGEYTFDYNKLLGTPVAGAVGKWLMLGFFAAFAVKLPAVPVHNWLPDAHTEAPTAGSVILAGLLLKTGAYGLLRFVLPLFPNAVQELAPMAYALGVISILYGAIVAFAQTDLKRLVAYTSVSHMGFVLIGIFAWNKLALQGTVMQMVCHGISTGALFMLVGGLQERIHTRDLDRMGGLWAIAPRMAAVAMVFAMASLGLPGMGNFVAEILVLMGAFKATIFWTVLATFGLVAATVYSLWMFQRAFHGSKAEEWKFADLGLREMGVMGALIVAIIWLGLYPQPVLNLAQPTIDALEKFKVEQVMQGEPSDWRSGGETDQASQPTTRLLLDSPAAESAETIDSPENL